MTYENILNLTEQILGEKIERGRGKTSSHDFEDALAMRTMFHALKFLYDKGDVDEELAEDYIRDMLRAEKDGH